MPEKPEVPTLITKEDFDENLNGFLNNKPKVALFLDYDGTLAAIASHPSLTEMSNETRESLSELASNPYVFVAVISGRGIEDVKEKVGIKHITYGGNHGIEIQNLDGTRSDYQLPEDIQKNYTDMVKEMSTKLNKNGAWVEDKRVSLTYHYRDADEDIDDDKKKEVIAMIESHGYKANIARRAIEAKPPIKWNKGEAALYLLRKNFGEDWKTNVKAIFCGDDVTDEDGMVALKGIGRSFRVSKHPDVVTAADYRLPSTNEITTLLQWIQAQYKD